MIGDGEDILASDYISTSAGAGDAGKVPKLDADGQLDRTFVAKHVRFGGTGADGALSISSGTTTLDIAGARIFVKNYTSIAITGTAKLAFSNPHAEGTIIVLRSQGNVTITSSGTPAIDLRNLGGTGGTSVSRSSVGSTNGNAGNPGTGTAVTVSAGTAGAASDSGSVGDGAASSVALALKTTITQLAFRYPWIAPGAGGGSGGVRQGNAGNTQSGPGGRGAGSLIIECAGDLNQTGTIDGSGQAATANSATATGYRIGGSGGGGGATVLIFYKTLTSASGARTVTGGTASSATSAGSDSGSHARGGVGGGSTYTASSSVGDPGASSQSAGSNGADGLSLVAENTELA